MLIVSSAQYCHLFSLIFVFTQNTKPKYMQVSESQNWKRIFVEFITQKSEKMYLKTIETEGLHKLWMKIKIRNHAIYLITWDSYI